MHRHLRLHAYKIQMRHGDNEVFFWNIVPCSLIEVHRCLWGVYCLHHCPDDGGSMHPRHTGQFQRDYMRLYPRRLSYSYSPLWEPKSSQGFWRPVLQYTKRYTSIFSKLKEQNNHIKFVSPCVSQCVRWAIASLCDRTSHFTENITTRNIHLDKLKKLIFIQTDDTESKIQVQWFYTITDTISFQFSCSPWFTMLRMLGFLISRLEAANQ
jgi:hypothetical protein